MTVAALAGVAATALALSGAGATQTVTIHRFDGTTRYDTARLVATHGEFAGAKTAIVTSGLKFPDALAGNYLAGADNGPVLLTDPGTLSPETAAALGTLHVTTVHILGGLAAVSASVESQLQADGYATKRYQGNTRDDTAAAIAESQPPAFVGSAPGFGPTALLASDSDLHFPDALAGGPMSDSHHFPTLLTPGDALAAQASAAFKHLGITHVIILGGTSAVSTAVELQVQALGISTARLQGANRAATAVAVAQYETGKLAYVTTHVDLARGDNFPDALAGGPHAAKELAPILLTDTPTMAASETTDFIKSINATLSSMDVFGGTGAVSDAVVAAEQGAATCNPTPPPSTTTTAPATTTTAPATTTTTLQPCTSTTTTILVVN